MLNYSPVHPARVNPEFIGVATKYSTIKKNRTSLEQDKNELLRRLKYRISVDRQLEKSLQENRSKLRTVRSVHRRHQDELEEVLAEIARKERGGSATTATWSCSTALCSSTANSSVRTSGEPSHARTPGTGSRGSTRDTCTTYSPPNCA
jgi:septal ring factor EnvC (AmiA/AmiB activator)